MVNIQLLQINYLAVLVAWVIHVVMGLIWFQPKLFGNTWSKLTDKELKPAPQWIIPGFFGHLLMVVVLAIFIKATDSNGYLSGLLIGFLAWLGFIVPMELGELVWEKIPFKLFLIRVGNQLIGLTVSGIILSVWQ